MSNYNILDHLPAYGTNPEHFGSKYQGCGFVVEFIPDNVPAWVGNFALGDGGGISTVIKHPNGKHLIVIAKGDGYIVDPETRVLQLTFSWGIFYYDLVPELQAIMFGNPCYFMAIGPAGLLWRTRDIAWGDGIQAIKRNGTSLSGESYNPLYDSWIKFSVNLADGNSQGGSSFNHPNLYD